MKAIVLPLLLTASFYIASAQDYGVAEKGFHHRVLQHVRETHRAGGVRFQTNHIVELQGGMHRWTDQGWVETNPKIELLKDGAVVRNLQYGAIFAPNLATPGAIDLSLPDGHRLTGHLLGLAYTEGNRSVLIAEVKDCAAVVGGAEQNELTYLDAFTDFKISVQYVTRRDRISQNLILEQQLPSPTEWGLTENAALEILTEFTAFPDVRKEPREAMAGLNTEHLSFASMEFVTGRGFSLGDEENSVLLGKSWELFEGNRWFLVEKVIWKEIAPELAQLPPVAKAWRKKENAVMARKELRLPNRQQARATIKPIQMATLKSSNRGYFIDWELVSSVNSNLWKGDTTYYIAGSITIKTNVFEGGCVIKYAPTNTAKLTITGPITFQGESYRPIVFTARDDHSVGEKIGNSSLSGYYADTAVYIDASTAGLSATLQNLRITSAKTALEINGRSGHSVSHVQIVNCQNGLKLTSAGLNLRNGLLHDVLTNFNGSSSTGRCEHLTVDTASYLNYNNACAELYLTNCLLVAVTNNGTITASNSVSAVSSSSGVFQTVGAGYHYLAANSPYVNAGTTGINSSLATDLRKLTTFPPILLTNNFTNSATLNPQAQRDTDLPDLGWHYAALDYAWSDLAVSNVATLLLTNGVAIASYGTRGIVPKYGSRLLSQGDPITLNRLVRYPAVQEQPINWGSTSGERQLIALQDGDFIPTEVRLRFTSLSALGETSGHALVSCEPQTAYDVFTLTDCSLAGGKVHIQGSSSPLTCSLLNNVFERVALDAETWLSFSINNNLFWKGSFNMYCVDESFFCGDWGAADNLFDGVSLSATFDPNPTFYNNAYVNCGGFAGEVNPVSLTNADYQIGPLGRFYYPTNGGQLSTLINAGATTANVLGLYHYTTTTNQVKETNSIVDIGFHYVATTNGVPIDTDLDGIPDYLEDANGNGSVNSGETDLASATDWGLRVLITRPRNGSILP